MSSTLIVGSALEGLGILAYAGLVFLALKLASRWADRALDAESSTKASPPTSTIKNDPAS